MRSLRGMFGISSLIVVMGLGWAGCTASRSGQQCEEQLERAEANLETFDRLDFDVFNEQRWTELHRSHSQDVLVYWPDGHSTRGLDKHTADLSWIFVWAPDTRIIEHQVRLGQGDWTAVISTMEGTFTQRMPLPDGSTLVPTGKPYSIRMATIAHWTRQGVMDLEYIFWDNREFMQQIGITPPGPPGPRRVPPETMSPAGGDGAPG